MPEEQQPWASPAPAKPPAGEEGEPRGVAHGDIPRIVESAVSHQLSKHEQALQALFQGMLNEQQAKFEASLADYWSRLGHEDQVNKLMREVVGTNSFLLRQLEEGKLEVLTAVAEAKQEMSAAVGAAVAEGTTTIVEHLKRGEERIEEERRYLETSRHEILRYMSRNSSDGMESGLSESLERGGTSAMPSDEVGRPETRSDESIWSRVTRQLCPSFHLFCKQARHARRKVQRSYSDKIGEFRHREYSNSILEYFVDNQVFEWAMVLVICLHIVYLVYQTDYSARTLQTASASENLAIEVCFLVVFSAELALKLGAQRMHFVFGPDRWWNLIDVILIVMGIFDIVAIQLQGSGRLSSSPLKGVRILQLLRVARLHRLLKTSQATQVILRCLASCWASLFGSAAILLLYFMVSSLFFVSAVTDHIMEGKGADQLEFFKEHFGSVSRCMLTLYASVSSGKDWLYFYEPLKEITSVNASAVFLLFSFVYMVVMVNIGSSILVQKVLIHTLDDSQNARHSMTRADHADTAWMLEFCARKYGHGDTVSYKDFLGLMLKPEFRELFTRRRVRLDDAELLFRAFARAHPGEGNVKNWELLHADRRLFFEACMRLKREVTPADLWKSRVALRDSQQRHCDLVMSTLHKIGLQLEMLSKDVVRVKRRPSMDI